MKALLIDIGSTNIKFACFHNGNVSSVKQISFPIDQCLPYPYFEVDIDLIMSRINVIIDKYDDLTDIFFSVQMHGYLLANLNKELLTPYISWQDKRSILEPYPYLISKDYGTALKDNLPKASVYAISKLDPILYNQVKHFYTLGSFLSYYFTNNNITHLSDAAPSGFYNVLTLNSDEMPFILPTTTTKVEVIGEYKGIRIHTPIGDQQAAIKGISPIASSYILNSGTAAQVCTINDLFISGEYESRPYFEGKTLCTITGLMGKKVVNDYRGNNLIREMINNYLPAIEKLPLRDHLVINCGTSKKVVSMFEEVAKNLKIDYSFYYGHASINGLKNFVEEYYEQNK